MSGRNTNVLEGSIAGHVFRMLGPFSIAVLALISTGIVDTIYLSRLTSPEFDNLGTLAIAAVGFAFPITFLGNSANIGLGAGTSSAVSRAIGQDDHDRAHRHGAAAILMALAVMTGLVTIMAISAPFVLPLMGAKGPVLAMAKDFLIISLPGLVIVSVAMMTNNILRARGEAIVPSAIMILGALLNIAIDPFLIFGIGPFPRMEVAGAALATVIGNTLAACIGLYIVWGRRKIITFANLTFKSLIRAWRVIGGVGIFAAFTNIIVPIGTLIVVTILGNFLTVEDIAAFTIAARAELLSVGVLYGLSACIGAITGRNGGAGKTDRVRETFRVCYWVCVVWSTLVAIPLFIFAEPITTVFTQDADVARRVHQYFRIVPITIFAYGFVFVSAAGLNALGRPLYGLTYTIIRSLILYTGCIAAGVSVGGLTGAFVGLAIANLISGAIAAGWTLTKAPMSAKES